MAGGAFSVGAFQGTQSIGDLRPFDVKRRQPTFQSPDLMGYVVGVGDLIVPLSTGFHSYVVPRYAVAGDPTILQVVDQRQISDYHRMAMGEGPLQGKPRACLAWGMRNAASSEVTRLRSRSGDPRSSI